MAYANKDRTTLCQKRPTHMSKETYIHVKRDLRTCQKRPTYIKTAPLSRAPSHTYALPPKKTHTHSAFIAGGSRPTRIKKKTKKKHKKLTHTFSLHSRRVTPYANKEFFLKKNIKNSHTHSAIIAEGSRPTRIKKKN